MSTMKVTLIGLNQFLHNVDDDLFKNMNLPEGIDKEVLTGNILLKGSDFEVMYADPYFMQDAIGLWSRKWYRTFDKWVTALAIEYNPLENYDRMEDWSDITDGSTSGRRVNGNTRTLNYTDTNTLGSTETRTLNLEDGRTLDLVDETTLDTTNTNTHDVSAYDSSTYQPADKSVTEDDGTNTTTHTGTDTLEQTGTDTLARTGNDTLSHSGTITDSFGEGMSTKNDQEVKHSGHIHGNVGVTTSQMMLSSELELAEWNLYEHITDLFLSEFVIPIYS